MVWGGSGVQALDSALQACKKGYDSVDGRKTPATLLAAFLSGKVAKGLVRQTATQVQSMTKSELISNKLAAVEANIGAWPIDSVVAWTIEQVKETVRELQLHAGSLPADTELPLTLQNSISSVDTWGWQIGTFLYTEWMSSLQQSPEGGYSISNSEKFASCRDRLSELSAWWSDWHVTVLPKLYSKEGNKMDGQSRAIEALKPSWGSSTSGKT